MIRKLINWWRNTEWTLELFRRDDLHYYYLDPLHENQETEKEVKNETEM